MFYLCVRLLPGSHSQLKLIKGWVGTITVLDYLNYWASFNGSVGEPIDSQILSQGRYRSQRGMDYFSLCLVSLWS